MTCPNPVDTSPTIRPAPGSLVDGLQAVLRGWGVVFACRDWRIVEAGAGVEVVDGAGRIVAEFAGGTDVIQARRALERIAKAYAASIAEAERRAAEDAEWEAMQLAAAVDDATAPARLFGDCGGGAGFRGELGFAGSGR